MKKLSEVENAMSKIIKSGVNSLDVFGIDGELISLVERNNPHITKQGGEVMGCILDRDLVMNEGYLD